jgi:hypothetical protein
MAAHLRPVRVQLQGDCALWLSDCTIPKMPFEFRPCLPYLTLRRAAGLAFRLKRSPESWPSQFEDDVIFC